MARPLSGRMVSFAEPCQEDEDTGRRESTELKELLLESHPSRDALDEPPPPSHVNRRFKLWRKRRRRSASNGLHPITARNFCQRGPCGGVRIFWRLLKYGLAFFLGIVVTVVAIPNADIWPGPDGFDRALHPFDPSVSSSHYPAPYFRSVIPIPCHSHNDYWRRRPLWSALCTGCISVEADVWLSDGELYVGHSGNTLEANNTLSNMYIEPLVDILEERNRPTALAAVFPTETRSRLHGVFFQDPEQTLTLLVDFKTDGQTLFPVVMEALEPLRSRGWLSHWDGQSRVDRPVTVVGTGNTPFDMVVANTSYRDIFLDAPLEALASPDDQIIEDDLTNSDSHVTTRAIHNYKYNPSNSHYASSSMTKAIGPLWQHQFSEPQIGLMRKQIRQAKERGLISRYWGTPGWPTGLRNAVWTVLVKEDVGILNVDDLRAARRGLWGSWPQPATDD